MAHVRIDDDEVVLELSGWEKLGAVRFRPLRLPRAAVRAVRRVEDPFREIRGFRLPGTSIPRLLALGTWRERGERDFLAVYRGRPGVVLELDGAQTDFARLIVGTADADDLTAQLT